jgi:uncharacterized protein YgiM (DUF1202 family)
VNLENVSEPTTATAAQTITATATSALNLRAQPTTTSAVTGNLQPGERIELTGRNSAGDWVVFRTDDDRDGWVFAPLLRIDDDVMTLPDTSPAQETDPARPIFAAINAIRLQTDPLDTDLCGDRIASGALIQAQMPDNDIRIQFEINEVKITPGTTILIATSDEWMTAYMLEGEAIFDAFDVALSAPAGAGVQVPLSGGVAAGEPEYIDSPYEPENLVLLPLSLLNEQISIAEPLPSGEIATGTEPPGDCTVSSSQSVNLRTGPGTSFSIGGQLADGDTSGVVGQNTGASGFTWYQLSNGLWVREDVIDASSGCETVVAAGTLLPTIAPPVQTTPVLEGTWYGTVR